MMAKICKSSLIRSPGSALPASWSSMEFGMVRPSYSMIIRAVELHQLVNQI